MNDFTPRPTGETAKGSEQDKQRERIDPGLLQRALGRDQPPQVSASVSIAIPADVVVAEPEQATPVQALSAEERSKLRFDGTIMGLMGIGAVVVGDLHIGIAFDALGRLPWQIALLPLAELSTGAYLISTGFHKIRESFKF